MASHIWASFRRLLLRRGSGFLSGKPGAAGGRGAGAGRAEVDTAVQLLAAKTALVMEGDLF